MADSSKLFVLMGPSGAGKSTILHHLEQKIDAESVPKYTTRPSRGTAEDAQDFMFCTLDGFPSTGLLRFESYGHLFGIQLEKISESFHRGKSHVTTVGGQNEVIQLASIFKNKIVTIFVYCDTAVLKSRLSRDASSRRVERWPQICEQIANVYEELACVEFIINNSGSIADTFAQLDRLLLILHAQQGQRARAGG